VTASTHAFTIVQTGDGGYAVGGNWRTAAPFGPSGALLLGLAGNGSIQSQTAFSGGLYCLDTETCTPIGGVVNSVHQTADGDLVLAGDADLVQAGEPRIVPWLARVDGSGALVWQEQDYQATGNGAALSEDFASSVLTPVGPLAVGATENPTNGLGELLGVQTDQNGTVASCSQVHPGSPLSPTDPGLTELTPDVAVTVQPASASPGAAQTLATTATATAAQC
jgi:hypothetical protein